MFPNNLLQSKPFTKLKCACLRPSIVPVHPTQPSKTIWKQSENQFLKPKKSDSKEDLKTEGNLNESSPQSNQPNNASHNESSNHKQTNGLDDHKETNGLSKSPVDDGSPVVHHISIEREAATVAPGTESVANKEQPAKNAHGVVPIPPGASTEGLPKNVFYKVMCNVFHLIAIRLRFMATNSDELGGFGQTMT